MGAKIGQNRLEFCVNGSGAVNQKSLKVCGGVVEKRLGIAVTEAMSIAWDERYLMIQDEQSNKGPLVSCFMSKKCIILVQRDYEIACNSEL